MRRGVIVVLVFLSLGIAFAPLSNQEGCESKGFTWFNESNYPATYSFTDDCIDCDPENWVVDESGGIVSVINSLGSHSRVAALEDTNSNSVYLYNDFTARESGTVELFMRINDMSQGAFRLALKDGGDYGLIVDMRGDYWTYHDGSPNNIIPASNNEWYHVRVDFECGSGGYQGLSSDTFYVYINGLRYGPYPFYTARSTLSRISFNTDSSNSGYAGYVDAVGYSWNPGYNLGDNKIGGCCGDDLIDLSNGLMSEWHFDESSGANAEDSVGNYDGTLNNMDDSDWVLGRYGNSLDFDGVDDYVDAGAIDLANSDFTLAAWVKRGEAGDSHYLMAQGHISTNQGLQFGFRNTDVFMCGFYYNDLDTTSTYTDTDWHHWVCTYDADTNHRRIYRDGVVVASDTASADYQNSGDPFYIGTRFGGSPTEQEAHFNGTIDEARVYNRALSEREAAYLYDTSVYNYYNYSDTFSSSYSGYCYANNYVSDLDSSAGMCDEGGFSYLRKDWWNPGWKYRKNITITENSGRDFTDYQVEIEPRTYSTDGLVGSYHFSEEGSFVKDYSSNNDGDLYGSTIALWHFDEAEGGTVYDSSIYSNSGTISGALWVDGYSGSALEFSSDYVSLPVIFDEAEEHMTFSAWIYANSLANSQNALFGEYTSSTADTRNYIMINTDGTLNFDQYTPSGDASSASGLVTTGTWIHVTVVKDGGTVYFYKNGELFSSAAHTETYTGGTPTVAGFGSRYRGDSSTWDSSYAFNGVIDEVVLSDKSFSAEQVKQLFYSQRAEFIEYKEGYEGKGTGLNFDGDQDHVNCGDNPDLDGSSFTLSTWVKPDALSGNGFVLFKGDWAAQSRALHFGFRDADTFTLAFYYDDLDYDYAFETDKWYHVVGRYDTTTNTQSIFINGEFKTSRTTTYGDLSNTNDDDLEIGRGYYGSYSNRGFNGTIDEVRVYNRPLSDDEINELYQETKGRYDYADLRFVNESGEELSYYHEYDDAVWVKTNLPASGSQDIKMYYGNPGAVSKSDAENTFFFYDDMNSYNLGDNNPGEWVDADDASCSSTLVSSYTDSQGRTQNRLVRADDNSGSGDAAMYHDVFVDKPYGTVEAYMLNTDAYQRMTIQFFSLDADGVSRRIANVEQRLDDWEWADGAGIPGLDNPFDNRWYRVSVHYELTDSGYMGLNKNYYTVTVTKTWDDTSQTATSPRAITAYTWPVGGPALTNIRMFTGRGLQGNDYYWDEVRYRQIAETEPTVTIGEQESVYGNDTGLVSYWSFDSDEENKIVDSVSKNHGSLYGGTVGLWHFNEGEGSTVDDETSYGNDGSITGASWSSGISGQALDFDGNDDYVSIPYDIGLSPTNAITFMVWAKADAKIDPYPRIISRASRDSHTEPYDSWNINFEGNLASRMSISGSRYDVVSTVTYASIQDEWHHYAVTFDGTYVIIYLDGEEVYRESHPGTIDYYNNQPVRIGDYEQASSTTFNGLIDEVAVYDTALSPDEIKYAYDSQRARFMDYSSGHQGKKQGLGFDGSDDYVRLSEHDSLDFTTGDFSVTAWFKTSTDIDEYQVIFSKDDDNPHNANAKFFMLEIPRNGATWGGHLYAHLADGDGVNEYAVNSSVEVIDGAWHHGVAVVDLTNLLFKIYLDGELHQTKSLSGFNGFDIDRDSYIGADGGEAGPEGSYFNGVIDEVRVYNRTLSPDEISELYNSTNLDYGCCGDEYYYDTFYNNSIGTTNHFCYEGTYVNEEIDRNQTVCEYYTYNYLEGIISGNSTIQGCCGDDLNYDYFWNDSNAFGSVCYYGTYYFESFDSSQSNCEAEGLTWVSDANYPATYSFTDDAVDSEPAGWLLDDDKAITVVFSEEGHAKVVEMSHLAGNDQLTKHALGSFPDSTTDGEEKWEYAGYENYDSNEYVEVESSYTDTNGLSKGRNLYCYDHDSDYPSESFDIFTDNITHGYFSFNMIYPGTSSRRFDIHVKEVKDSGTTQAQHFRKYLNSFDTGFSGLPAPSNFNDEWVQIRIYFECRDGYSSNDGYYGLNSDQSKARLYHYDTDTWYEGNIVSFQNAVDYINDIHFGHQSGSYYHDVRLNDMRLYSGNMSIENVFATQSSGTAELYLKTSSAGSDSYNSIKILDGANTLTHLRVNNDNWEYYDGTIHTLRPASADTWYHARIDFNSAGWDVFIDGVSEGTSLPYVDSWVDGADSLQVIGDTNQDAFTTHVDAIGYSWDPDYSVGDNALASCCGDDVGEYFFNDSNAFGSVCYNSSYYYEALDQSQANCEAGGLTWVSDANYPGTYSFTGDCVGSVPLGWTDTSQSSGTVSVILDLSGHNKVLFLDDNGADGKAVLEQDFTAGEQDNGTIEYWVRVDDVTNWAAMAFKDSGDNYVFSVRITNDKWRYHDGSSEMDIPGLTSTPSDNTWHHVRVDFESTTGGYQGLAQWDWRVTIDGSDVSNDINFRYNGKPDYARLTTDNDGVNAYFDAVGYSWDPDYELGDNALASCCGDDVGEYFFNDSESFGSVCYAGDYYYEALDQSQANCEAAGLNWLTDVNYPGTYSFTDNSIGSNPTGWTVDETGGTVQVLSDLGGHYKIVEFYDTSGDDNAMIEQDFTDGAQESGTVEYWVRSDDVSKSFIIRLQHSVDGNAVLFRWDSDKFQAYDSSSWSDITGITPQDNTWYHIKLAFECSSGGYEGLSADTFKVWINGIEFGDYEFSATKTTLDHIQFYSNSGDNGYKNYLDSIGYSWDPDYELGDNALASCCGDDFLDIFYNGSIGSTNNFCHDGYFTLQQIDLNQTICEHYDYGWLSGSLGGDISYLGTYSFEGETGQTGTGISFVNSYDGVVPEVIAGLDGHSEVLMIEDDSVVSRLWSTDIDQYDGTVEFWVRGAQDDKNIHLLFDDYDGATQVEIRLFSGLIRAYDGGSITNLQSFSADKWYHLRVDFDVGTNTFDVYVDSVKKADQFSFKEASTANMKQIYTQTYYVPYTWYFDAFGFSSDNSYAVGDNKFFPRCCGDDGSSDLFYNGTINSSNHFCQDGYYHEGYIDNNQTLCDAWGYNWTTMVDWFNVTQVDGLGISADFNATYSFTNDAVGATGADISFVDTDSSSSGCTASVVSSKDSYSKVLELEDTSTTCNVKIINDFPSAQSAGTIEFYVMTTDVSKTTAVYVRSGSINTGPIIRFNSNNIEYYDTTGGYSVAQSAASNDWYYFKIVFDASTNSYDLYVDDVLVGDDGGFVDSVSSLDNFEVQTWYNMDGFSTYFDAIGYSWDPDYDSGDNRWLGLCCGDDGVDDNFFNNTATCSNGEFLGEGDESQSSCESNGYTWFTGSITGTNGPCCGDDGVDDDFYNGSISTTTHFCQDGVVINQEIDYNNTLCEYYAYDWLDNVNPNGFTPPVNLSATFSFTDDADGVIPAGWTSYSGFGYLDPTVVTSVDGLSKVLEFHDPTDVDSVATSQTFSGAQINGTVEFYIRTNNTAGNFNFGFSDAGLSTFYFNIGVDNGQWMYDSDSDSVVDTVIPGLTTTPQAGEWHHLIVHFRGSGPAYQGLSNNQFKVIVDGSDVSDIINFPTVGDPEAIFTGTLQDDAQFKTYLDALGYSWEDYSIGDNTRYSCCGDDSADDNFFNNTLGCYQGSLTKQKDVLRTFCEYFESGWLTGTTYGNYPRCCGDDYIINGYWDNFYNSTHLCYGEITTNADLSKGYCEVQGYDWFSSDGSFASDVTYSAANGPRGIAVGDLDGDGDLDVVNTNVFPGTISVFLGNGDGTFAADVTYSVEDNPYDAAIVDLNNDGDLDIVVNNHGGFSNTISVFLGNGDGTFPGDVTYGMGTNPRGLAVGDFDNDGYIDVVTCNLADFISVRLNNGDGTFGTRVTYNVGNEPFDVAVGDFNDDDYLDIVVTNRGDPSNYNDDDVSVLLNNGDGTFANDVLYSVQDKPQGVTIADFNEDGGLDIAAVNSYQNTVSVLFGNGDGTFAADVTYSIGGSPFDVAASDFNLDGHLDIVATNPNQDRINIRLGNGDGTFDSAVSYTVGDSPFGVAAGDFDSDGDIDVVTANYYGDDISVLLSNGLSGVNAPCCGDDITSDDFYNGSLGTTRNFCLDAEYFPQTIDYNQTLCEARGYDWLGNLSDGLVAYWRLDDNEGTIATDDGGNYDGTLSGPPTWTTGRHDYALDFDGSDYVSTNLDIDQDGSDDYTFSVWAYPTESNDQKYQLVSTDNGDFDWGIMHRDGTWRVFWGSGVSQLHSVDLNEWQYLVAVFEAGVGVSFYKNGIEATTSIGHTSSDNLFNIGRNPSGGENFIGNIDDVRIYNRALSESEIKSLYNSPPYDACCGDDSGEDWSGNYSCCCNERMIGLGDTCDTNEDFVFDSVCDNQGYCNSSTKPGISLSDKTLSEAQSVDITLTSECRPNLLIINPNLTETQLSTSTCGANCYEATYTPSSVGYHHVQAFNGEYNYDMFVVKNDSLSWINLWESADGEQFRYKNDININHSLNHSRINQLVSINMSFNQPAYCEDVNADGDYNDPMDKLGMRLVNRLPGNEYYEVPMTLTNVTCTPENNLTSARIWFSLNLPPQDNAFTGTGNIYSVYYGPFDYNVKSYAGLDYMDGFNRYVNNSVFKVEYNLISNITQTLINYLGTDSELQAAGDVIISPLEYHNPDHGVTYTFKDDGDATYEINATPAFIYYGMKGTLDSFESRYNQTYNPNSYYLIFKTGIEFLTQDADWFKHFELNLNKDKFNYMANSTNVYGLDSAVDFDYETPWLAFFNTTTGDGVGLVRIKSSGVNIKLNSILKYEVSASDSIIGNYPVYTTEGLSDVYTSEYALMVFNYSGHGYDKVSKVWEWLNTSFNYSIIEEEVSFDITDYEYDRYVDQSDELIAVNASIYANTQDVNAIHADVYDFTGNKTFSQNYNCTLVSNYLYDCNFTINPEGLECKDYNLSIYGVGVTGNTTSVSFKFNIDDIIGSYDLPQDTVITTDQELTVSYEYCSENNSPENINLTVLNNDAPLYSDYLSSTGEEVISYTNPSVSGFNNFTLNANDTTYWDYNELTGVVVQSGYELNTERRIYSQGAAGYRSNFLTINNPSMSVMDYDVSINSDELNVRFSENKDDSLSLSIPPYSSAVIFIDVFPVTIGTYSVSVEVNSQVPLDSDSLSFNAVIQTVYSTGFFDYVMTPGLDWAAILILLLLASIFILKQNF